MNILTYFILAIAGLLFIIFIIGLLLPDERIETSQIEYNAPPEKVYNILINNKDYTYRSDLKTVTILKTEGDIETWKEIAKNGSVTEFKTTRKIPFSRYEFDIIKGNGFTGHWTGMLEKTESGRTLFTSKETIRIKNPFLKTISYLFFDMKKFMTTYQNDLKKKL